MSTKLHPYLNFNPEDAGNAMKFYHAVFGGDLKVQTFGDVGMAKTPAEKDHVIHAELRSGDIIFMASSGHEGLKVHFGDNVHMSLMGEDEAKLTEYFNKLAEGGKVDMPLAKQFWGDIYGQLTDKYGVHWMVNISSGQKPQK